MAHYCQPYQWSCLEIERLVQGELRQLRINRFAFSAVEVTEIYGRQRQSGKRMNELHQLAIDHGKRGAKAFVSTTDLIERLFQRRPIQWTIQPHAQIDVKSRRALREFFLKP